MYKSRASSLSQIDHPTVPPRVSSRITLARKKAWFHKGGQSGPVKKPRDGARSRLIVTWSKGSTWFLPPPEGSDFLLQKTFPTCSPRSSIQERTRGGVDLLPGRASHFPFAQIPKSEQQAAHGKKTGVTGVGNDGNCPKTCDLRSKISWSSSVSGRLAVHRFHSSPGQYGNQVPKADQGLSRYLKTVHFSDEDGCPNDQVMLVMTNSWSPLGALTLTSSPSSLPIRARPRGAENRDPAFFPERTHRDRPGCRCVPRPCPTFSTVTVAPKIAFSYGPLISMMSHCPIWTCSSWMRPSIKLCRFLGRVVFGVFRQVAMGPWPLQWP